MSIPLVHFKNWDGLVSLSRLSLFSIGFTHCVDAFGFLDVLQLIIHQSKTTGYIEDSLFYIWKSFAKQEKTSCCSLLSYLGKGKSNKTDQTWPCLQWKWWLAFTNFFEIFRHASKRKLCYHNISWNQTIRKSFHDSFIFRIDCAAWNELRFSQRSSKVFYYSCTWDICFFFSQLFSNSGNYVHLKSI